MIKPLQKLINKSVVKYAFRLTISFLLIAYLTYYVNWRIIYYSIMKINLTYYILSTVITFITSLVLAFKYNFLIKKSNIKMSVFALFKINLISRFYSLFLPTAAAAPAVRWYKVTRNKSGRGFFFVVSVFERLTFCFVVIFFAFSSYIFIPYKLEITNITDKIIVLLIIAFIIVNILLLCFVSSHFRKIIYKIIEVLFPRKISQSLFIKLNNNDRLFEKKKLLLFYVLFISLVWQLFFVLRVFLLFEAASIPLGFCDIAWLSSLVLIVQILPISFAGIGLRECMYASLLSYLNFSSESGATIGILLSSQILILSIFGGLYEVTKSDRFN